jgi:hypothetical protein
VLVLGSVTVLPVSAQRSTSGRPGSSGTSSTGQNNSPTATASKQVADAQRNVNKIQSDMAKAKTRVKAQLLAKPEFAAVNAEYTKAKAAEELAKKQAINALHNKPEFQRLQKERADAQAKVDSANTGGQQVNSSEIQDGTATIFKDGIALQKMETQALADDAKYQDAKAKADAAKTKVDAVDTQVAEALKNDPDYDQLSQQLDQAKQQLDQARQSLQQAAQADRQQREQEAKSRASSGSGSGGGRGR